MADSEKLYLSVAQLRDFYDVERQLTRAVSKLPQGTSWFALRDAFETHLAETRREIGRLEQVVERLWEMIYQHHDAVLPARACTVRIPVGRSTTTEPTSVPHNREDYDGDDDTLVAWARAIGDDDSNDYGSDHMPDTKPHEIGPEPSTEK